MEGQRWGDLHIHCILWALLHYKGEWFTGDTLLSMVTNNNNDKEENKGPGNELNQTPQPESVQIKADSKFEESEISDLGDNEQETGVDSQVHAMPSSDEEDDDEEHEEPDEDTHRQQQEDEEADEENENIQDMLRQSEIEIDFDPVLAHKMSQPSSSQSDFEDYNSDISSDGEEEKLPSRSVCKRFSHI